jgi:formylglycine-generating enzyme required for sulfatase activity
MLILITGGFATGLSQMAKTQAVQRRADEGLARSAAEELGAISLVSDDAGRRLRAWIARGEELAARLPDYRAELNTLRQRGKEQPSAANTGLPMATEGSELLRQQQLTSAQAAAEKPAAQRSPDEDTLSELYPLFRAEVDFSAGLKGEPRRFAFESETDQEEHQALSTLVYHGLRLVAPNSGVLARARQKLELVESLEDLEKPEAWEQCRRSVANRSECPAYGGLDLAPQRGLVPLRRDPDSGLWEFLHVLSGSAPEIGKDGHYILGPKTGIVLVLVPGGGTLLGARETEGPPWERPLLEVQLAWFFIGKYELTQSQWHHLSGDLPSRHFPGFYANDAFVGLTHPVEFVDHETAQKTLAAVGLTLPTEAQWEWSARAGDNNPENRASTYWSSTADPTQHANFGDAAFEAGSATAAREKQLKTDGWWGHSPVGSFPPNGFGLHDMLGNISEWCLDWRVEALGGDRVTSVNQGRDGLLTPKYFVERVSRGGAFNLGLEHQRLSAREPRQPLEKDWNIGVRAARALDPR